MNKKINAKITQYIIDFKNNVRDRVLEIDEAGDSKKPISDFIAYLYEYPRLVLTDEDFSKRKREKNTIPILNRCNAKRSCGNQCTRKRKDGFEFCGTHYKGAPHGFVEGRSGEEDGEREDEGDNEDEGDEGEGEGEESMMRGVIGAVDDSADERSANMSSSSSSSSSCSVVAALEEMGGGGRDHVIEPSTMRSSPPAGRDSCPDHHHQASNKGGGGGGGGVKLEIFAKDIGGIIYYVDKWSNVYDTEDILSGKQDPRIFSNERERLSVHSSVIVSANNAAAAAAAAAAADHHYVSLP